MSTITSVFSAVWRTALRRTFSTALRSNSLVPDTKQFPVETTRTVQLRPRASKSASVTNSSINSSHIDRRPVHFLRTALKTGQHEQFAYKCIKPLGFQFDSFQRVDCILTVAPARNLQGKGQPCKRRTELVRDISKETFLRADQRFDTLGHQVEIPPELGNLITPPAQNGANTNFEVSVGQMPCRRPKFADRHGNIACKPVTYPSGSNKDDDQVHCQESCNHA